MMYKINQHNSYEERSPLIFSHEKCFLNKEFKEIVFECLYSLYKITLEEKKEDYYNDPINKNIIHISTGNLLRDKRFINSMAENGFIKIEIDIEQVLDFHEDVILGNLDIFFKDFYNFSDIDIQFQEYIFKKEGKMK